jgi:hypothetical protein
MEYMQLQHNTTEINFRNPSTGELCIVLPGQALYESRTGYIIILKISDSRESMILQLLPRTVSNRYRNRAIAEVGKTFISAFSAGFLDDLTGAALEKMADLTLPSVADGLSNATASQKFGYYDIQTKDLVFDFPIRLAL